MQDDKASQRRPVVHPNIPNFIDYRLYYCSQVSLILFQCDLIFFFFLLPNLTYIKDKLV